VGQVLAMRRDDRGGSAVEAALLIAAVAVVILPALFLLGRAVDSAFGKPCEELPDSACASSASSDGGSDGGHGTEQPGGDERPPADLSTRVTDRLRGEGATSAVCTGPVTVNPPERSTTCQVTFADSRPPGQYLVVYREDSDDLTLRPV
jgi:Flp pilus assembly pilin Flp